MGHKAHLSLISPAILQKMIILFNPIANFDPILCHQLVPWSYDFTKPESKQRGDVLILIRLTLWCYSVEDY